MSETPTPGDLRAWADRVCSPESSEAEWADLFMPLSVEAAAIARLAADTLEALEASRAREARLREALEFYADRDLDGYDVHVTDYGMSTDNGRIIKDHGERARAALAGEASTPAPHPCNHFPGQTSCDWCRAGASEGEA